MLPSASFGPHCKTTSVGQIVILFLSCAVPPTATVGPRSETASVGQTVQFTCQASGSPQPRISWSKEGGQLPAQHNVQNGVLTYVQQNS